MEVDEIGLSLKDLGLSDWNKIDVNEYCLLFYNNNGYGFDFRCVYFSGQDMSEDFLRYKSIFNGNITFDGVRHMYFDEDSYSDKASDSREYFNYPDIPTFIEALQTLDKLVIDNFDYVVEERLKYSRTPLNESLL